MNLFGVQCGRFSDGIFSVAGIEFVPVDAIRRLKSLVVNLNVFLNISFAMSEIRAVI